MSARTADRAVLWDMDGTLIDSADHHWRAWQEIMRRAGVEITREQFQSTFGQRNDRILSQWLGDSLPPERVRMLGETKEECYRDLVREEGVHALPGAERWIVRLASENWVQAIASSAPRRNVEVVLAGLGLTEYFAAVVAAEDVRRGKPEPDVFLAAADRLGVPAARCVVVEDAAAGIEAARRAGMVSVMIGSRGDTQADIVAASLDDLREDVFERLSEQMRA